MTTDDTSRRCECDLTGMTPPAIHLVDGHHDPADTSREALIERVAKAIHAEKCCPCDPDGCSYDGIAAEWSAAVAIVDALGLAAVYTLAWDGEPSMSGKPHRRSLGGDRDLDNLRTYMQTTADSGVKQRPNVRIERRYVTNWERVDDGR